MTKKKKVAIRRSWKIHPATKVEKSPKQYQRNKEKKTLRKLIRETDFS